MSDWVVRVEGVSKKFSLSLRSGLKHGLADSARRLFGLDKDSHELRPGEFWALRDVSIELGRGEALGVMGVNGSGKTTLLRILNGSYSPDTGRVMMRGRIGALIAAGAGFSPMLTGRENIFVSGSLLGMSDPEIRRHFDEIVHFADLEQFIDMPVRNYSSGMSVRLGFAVAVLGEPDILLVDEVLAVGDISFQKRCYERILKMQRNGTTVIFVSHSVGAIWAVCTCGLFLDEGRSSGKIPVEELGRAYDLRNFRGKVQEKPQQASGSADDALPNSYGGARGGEGSVFVDKLEIGSSAPGNTPAEIGFGEPLLLRMHVRALSPIPNVLFRYSIDSVHYKFIFTTDSAYADGMGPLNLPAGRYVVTTEIPRQSLRPGIYTVNLAVCQRSVGVHLYFQAAAGQFVVKPPTDRFFYDSEGMAVVHFDSRFEIVPAMEETGS